MALTTSQKRQLETAKRDLAQIEKNIRIYQGQIAAGSVNAEALKRMIRLEQDQKRKTQNTINALEREARRK